MYNKYRHSHDRRKKKGSGSNLLSTCHCFKSGKVIQFISIHIRVNSIYFYIHAHCSDEVASDSKKVRWKSGQKKLSLDAIEQSTEGQNGSTVLWKQRVSVKCNSLTNHQTWSLKHHRLNNGSQRKSNGNDKHREVDKNKDQANNAAQKKGTWIVSGPLLLLLTFETIFYK